MEELNLEIGTKEIEGLKEAAVEIREIKVEVVRDNNNKKVVCYCKHPDKEDVISISAVKYQVKDKIVSSGLWLNLDEDKLIRKGSALALFLEKVCAKTPSELQNKALETTFDEKGYLVFKCY